MILPVIIFASSRTGSTVFGSQLARRLGLPFYSEPFTLVPKTRVNDYDAHMKFRQQFIDLYKSGSNQYVLKFMSTDMSADTPYTEIMAKNCYKIRISRRNVVDQVVSYYIAKKTNRFHRYVHEPIQPFRVDLDKDYIHEQFQIITTRNYFLFNNIYTFDDDVYYEDLGNIEDTHYRKNEEPENIEELRQFVRELFWKHT